MTTNVIVQAHCDKETKIVEVQVIDGDNDGQNIHIEDGDQVEFLVFDDRELIVKEVMR